ncbi:hypothetical protein DYQ86_18810 [Acidobacteria bacterium AB60]|nr:hypothetical protein DYQ86_18810 [Acidobacteria bacterium AB60]
MHMRKLLLPLLVVLFTPSFLPAAVQLQPCKNNITPAQQIEIGNKAAQQVYQQMPVEPDSSRVTQYVAGLGQKLAPLYPGYRWPYNFHVVNVADINAFALPGGSIFVNLGTIQAASNEAQLTAVLAHEMSHVVLQHSICNLEKEQRVGILAGLGQLATGALLGNSTLGALAQRGIGLGAGLSFLRMGRDAEQQADMEGVSVLYDAGYDPRAMPQFFETIQAKYGNGGAQLLSDHPNPGNRTEYVDREIATFQPKPRYVTNTPQFTQIHTLVAGMHAYTSKEVDSGVWRSKYPNQSGLNSYDPSAPAGQVDLRAPQSWTSYKGDGFTLDVPANWQSLGNTASGMIAPPGGIGPTPDGKGANLIYGILTGTYQSDASASATTALSGLLAQFTHDNPGLQSGPVNRLTLNGVQAADAHCLDRNANNSRGEHDWIAGIPVSGGMRYFVFVSPEPDFNTMRPVFERILNSVKVR